MLGGTVHRILENVTTDVAILVDRGYLGARKILVPYLGGGEHDRLALQLAARAARGGQAEVVVLHVRAADGRNGKPSAAKSEVERVLNAAAQTRTEQQPLAWEFRAVEDASPVDAVLREAGGYDLIVIGVSEQWGLESHLFGLRSERIAQESPTTMLIVRKHGESREPVDISSESKSDAAEALAAPVVTQTPKNPD
jgi:nucleotide-binding universal stress UspA family protein